MIALLITCAVICFIIGALNILTIPQYGLSYVLVMLFAGAFFLALAEIIRQLRNINGNLVNGVCEKLHAPGIEHHDMVIGGIRYEMDPSFGKSPAPNDGADIWPDVDDAALRHEIVQRAKTTDETHVTVRGRMYTVKINK